MSPIGHSAPRPAMAMDAKRLAIWLAYAGTIPFVIAAVLLMFGKPLGLGTYRPLALQGITTYAAVIVSFLGGIQWGIGIATHDVQPQSARSLFLLSVVPSLLAWAMLFLPPTSARVIVAIFLVGFVWVVDGLLHIQQIIPAWFFRVRSIVSSVVIAALVLALVATT